MRQPLEVFQVGTAVAVEAELVTLETHQTFLQQAEQSTPVAVVAVVVVAVVRAL
jgi:hypothetical protein